MRVVIAVEQQRRATTFIGGASGPWRVESQRTISGPAIEPVAAVDIVAGAPPGLPPGARWALWGVTTGGIYTTAEEKAALVRKQAPIGRPESTRAALIPLRKNAAWWALGHDERRRILEEDSHHIAIGMRYLPAIARNLLHCRDAGIDGLFDFLAFLDYAPADAAAFDDLMGLLRATNEWSFIDREVDIRLAAAER